MLCQQNSNWLIKSLRIRWEGAKLAYVEKTEMFEKFLYGHLKQASHLEDLGEDVKIYYR